MRCAVLLFWVWGSWVREGHHGPLDSHRTAPSGRATIARLRGYFCIRPSREAFTRPCRSGESRPSAPIRKPASGRCNYKERGYGRRDVDAHPHPIAINGVGDTPPVYPRTYSTSPIAFLLSPLPIVAVTCLDWFTCVSALQRDSPVGYSLWKTSWKVTHPVRPNALAG